MIENHLRFLKIATSKDFEIAAIATFNRQYEENIVYRSYCDLLNISPSEIKTTKDIPFLPIQFFKYMR